MNECADCTEARRDYNARIICTGTLHMHAPREMFDAALDAVQASALRGPDGKVSCAAHAVPVPDRWLIETHDNSLNCTAFHLVLLSNGNRWYYTGSGWATEYVRSHANDYAMLSDAQAAQRLLQAAADRQEGR